MLALFSLEGGGGTEDGMYTELWNLCAGPLVTVPRVGDKVYYFPQGHIEQVSCPIRLSSSVFRPPLPPLQSRVGTPFFAGVSGFRYGVSGNHGGVSVGMFSGIPLLMGQFCSRELFSWNCGGFCAISSTFGSCGGASSLVVHWPAGESSGVYFVGSQN